MNDRNRGNILTRDYRYVYLAGSLAALLALSLIYSKSPTPYSFITAGGFVQVLFTAVCAGFCLVSAAALIVKLIHWDTYSSSFFKKPVMVKLARYLSYAVAVVFLLTFIDRFLLHLLYLIQVSKTLESNPEGFVDSMVYMSVKGSGMLITGIWTTIRIALMGTAIAFFLALLLVFLRIQTPNKRDNDLIKAVKIVASMFARFYIFIIRGTPMMVQALIFYYFGFNLFKKTGMTVTEINHVWSFFISGLCTVSLNSTAYLAEVLRGGIQAIDGGQMEAERSLGMTNWQAMIKVVFPQAVKNSIPAIGNEFIINIKDSSVLSVIGVLDLMYATKSVSGIYYRSLEIYCVAAVLYLVLTWLSSLLLKYISKKMETPAQGIPSSN